MAFLSTTPFVKEELAVEYYGAGDLENTRDRITITVQYACDADGHATETIPATRDTTYQTPGTTCKKQRVSVGPGYDDLMGLCTIIYEATTAWALVT
jgi:hypothetical protein